MKPELVINNEQWVGMPSQMKDKLIEKYNIRIGKTITGICEKCGKMIDDLENHICDEHQEKKEE